MYAGGIFLPATDKEKIMVPLIQLHGINKSFIGVRARCTVDLEIRPGEIVCLAGENGCGKSTLIKILSGFYTPDSGDIYVEGRQYKSLTPRESMKNGIQVVYQDFSLFPNMTVGENIGLNRMLVNKRKITSKTELNRIAEAAFKKIGINIPLDTKVDDLPVADKQLVAIARAIINDAKFVIFDEPTSAITYNEVQALFRVIRQLKDDGISILFVSHKLDEIFSICDRMYVLRNGENVINGDIGEFTRENLVYYMTGKEYSSVRIADENRNNEVVLEVRDLSLDGEYENINFKVHKGEVLGITGLLGSGRTALAQSLYGISPHTSGEILINGKTVEIRNVKDAIANRICYVPEDRLTEGIFIDQSISRNIIISSLENFCRKLGIVDAKNMQDEVNKWIQKLRIKIGKSSDAIGTLSGGNQQKAVIARGLAINPRVVILNCPTVGVDIGARMDISALIQDIAKQGACVVLISDDSSEILTNCYRFLIIRKGRIAGEYMSKDFTEESLYKQLTEEKETGYAN